MDRNFFFGILIGGAIGAVLGMIYAPAPGAETRVRITEQSKRAADRVAKTASSVTKRAKDTGEKVKQAM